MPSLLDYMQDVCLDLEFCSGMMGEIPSKAIATSHTKMFDSMADGDLEFELPTSTVEKFRKMSPFKN